jgi:hypothetical protein
MARLLLAALAFIAALAGPSFAAGALEEIWQATHWGEASDQLARQFGGHVVRLSPPIEFGDAYVDVALKGEMLGGYPFVVYFQMDKRTHGLKRIHFERPRHGVNPKVFRAVMDALDAEFGPPAKACNLPPDARGGYQAATERLWHRDGAVIRAALRDTTLSASEGCLFGDASAIGACGATGQLFVQISADAPGADACR